MMRSVLENGLHRGSLPVKLWYAGPFFPRRTPATGPLPATAAGGVEAIGIDDPLLDAEVIAIADEGYRGWDCGVPALCVLDRLPDVPAGYREALQEFLAGLPLDEPTAERARLNPLRARRQAPRRPKLARGRALPPDHLCDDCREHFSRCSRH